jgi:hypothetical protein
MSEHPPERIEAVFLNGSVTAVGVVVGFSPTYLTSWASRPSPWQLHDLIAIVPLAAGSVLQLLSLSALLHTNSLERPIYDRAVRLFLIGLVLVCVSLVGVITVDAVIVAKRS